MTKIDQQLKQASKEDAVLFKEIYGNDETGKITN